MRFVKIGIIALITICAGCAHSLKQSASKYSIQTESSTNDIIQDGLPGNSPKIDSVVGSVNRKLATKLKDDGFVDGLQKVKLKYNIQYYAHRALPPIPFVLYWLKYDAEITVGNESKTINTVINNDGSANILELTDEVAENLHKFIITTMGGMTD